MNNSKKKISSNKNKNKIIKPKSVNRSVNFNLNNGPKSRGNSTKKLSSNKKMIKLKSKQEINNKQNEEISTNRISTIKGSNIIHNITEPSNNNDNDNYIQNNNKYTQNNFSNNIINPQIIYKTIDRLLYTSSNLIEKQNNILSECDKLSKNAVMTEIKMQNFESCNFQNIFGNQSDKLSNIVGKIKKESSENKTSNELKEENTTLRNKLQLINVDQGHNTRLLETQLNSFKTICMNEINTTINYLNDMGFSDLPINKTYSENLTIDKLQKFFELLRKIIKQMKNIITDKENVISKLTINKKLSDNMINNNVLLNNNNDLNKSDYLNKSNFNIPSNFSEKRKNFNIPMIRNSSRDFSLRTNLKDNRNLSNMSDNLFFSYEDNTSGRIKNDRFSQIQLFKDNDGIPGLENNYSTQKNTKLNNYKSLLFSENLNKVCNPINNNLIGNSSVLNNIKANNKF